MPFALVRSAALLGLDAFPVQVEVDAMKIEEMSRLVIVGLPDAAVREAKDRVLTAIKNSGISVRGIFGTVNLAPGDLKKEGALYDLPIALGLVSALDQHLAPLPYLVVGELGLNGEVRSIYGAIAMALLARDLKLKGILLPESNAAEASAVPGIDIIPVKSLSQAIAFVKNTQSISPYCRSAAVDVVEEELLVDFAEIKGQMHAKRALEIAAAGGHNIVMLGPPGCGKSMMAKAVVGILPKLTMEQALETTKIHSIAGLLERGEGLIKKPPFRSPHHTVSYAGLIGGGAYPRPGEVSLAHHGVLFLDELPEFSRLVLEVLRQPLEDRCVTISRAQGNFTFPANILCIAAMNPCPCGYLGHPDKRCTDTEVQVLRYKQKISGPLWDRIDLRIEVPALKYKEIAEGGNEESSAVVRGRVIAARTRQHERYAAQKSNAQMSAKEMKKHCRLDAEGSRIVENAFHALNFSARSFDRILRVARTIADLEGVPDINAGHLMEALAFR